MFYATRNDAENRVCFLAVFYLVPAQRRRPERRLLRDPAVHRLGPAVQGLRSDPVETGAGLLVLGASILSFNIAFNLYTAGFFSYQESHWKCASASGLSRILLLSLVLLCVLSLQGFFLNLVDVPRHPAVLDRGVPVFPGRAEMARVAAAFSPVRSGAGSVRCGFRARNSPSCRFFHLSVDGRSVSRILGLEMLLLR